MPEEANIMISKEYKRSCLDELEWNEVDQLHEAILNLSDSCYKYKEICVALLGAAMTTLIALTQNKINDYYFIILISITLGFWFTDATAYYYQRKLREKIHIILAKIAKRNEVDDYQNSKINFSIKGALFNSSMTLYYLILALGLSTWIMYAFSQAR